MIKNSIILECQYLTYQHTTTSKMGGNAIKTVEITRFDMDVYTDTKVLIGGILRDSGFDIDFLYEVPNKTDFGDLDILYTPCDKNVLDIVKEKFNPVEYHINGGVLSFAYQLGEKYYQIDLIEAHNIESYKFYMSYGDVGNIIGKMLKAYGLHLGTQGLFVKPIIGGCAKQIVLSDDPERICEFLGVEYVRWHFFETDVEIYDWLISIKYFNSSVFVAQPPKNTIGSDNLCNSSVFLTQISKNTIGSDNLCQSELRDNHQDRRQQARKFYQDFLEYLKTKPKPIESIIKKEDLSLWMIRIFNKDHIYHRYIVDHERDQDRRKKFNAKKFAKFGFEGKELGITMRYFKQHIENHYRIEFNDWLDHSDDTMIQKHIEEWHRQFTV